MGLRKLAHSFCETSIVHFTHAIEEDYRHWREKVKGFLAFTPSFRPSNYCGDMARPHLNANLVHLCAQLP